MQSHLPSLQGWREWEMFALLSRERGAKYQDMSLLQCLPAGCILGAILRAPGLGGAVQLQSAGTSAGPHPCLLPILHLLTSLTPSGKEQCPSAYLRGLLGAVREPVGKKAVGKQPVALQAPGERTSLSPSRQGPWTGSMDRLQLHVPPGLR